jgi:hypothetical protein
MLPVVALFFFLSIQEPVRIDDCNSYVILMGFAPWKMSYWQLLHHAFRGWTVPVFFSAFGQYSVASAQWIVVAQALLLLVSTTVFALTVASRFASSQHWWISMTVIVTLAFQQGYLLFSSFLLSDSLAWTLVLFLLAIVLVSDRLLLRFGYFRFAALYLIVGWMATGARDANQQLLIILTAYLLVRWYTIFTGKQVALLAAGVLCICGVQAHYARSRYRFNMENVLVGRILPDPDARRFFVRHGMPPALAELGHSLSLQPLEAVNISVVEEERKRFERSGTRYLDAAPKTYLLWLLTHPGRVAQTLFADRAFIFTSDFLWLEESRLQLATVARRLETGSETDKRSVPPFFAVRQELLLLRPSVMERIPLLLRFALLLSLSAWAVWRNSRSFFKDVGGFALLVSIAGIVNACSGFIADTWQLSEMERHAAIGNMLFNTGTLILLLWAVQEVATYRKWLGCSRVCS